MGKFNNIKDAQKEVEARLAKLGKAVAIQVFDNIIIQSPVDTGRFRGNWQASFGHKIDTQVPETTAKGRIENNYSKLSPAKLSDTLYLSNNLPYAEVLEYGHSKQKPSGWVRATVAKAQEILNKKANEVGG